MPYYLFTNPKTGETKEVFQNMNDPHVYEEGGEKWDRVFTVPNACIDADFDPFSERKFLEKTANGGTVGDLWDRSEEWSRKRAEKRDGVDKIREAEVKKNKAKRGGKTFIKDLD